ncbi:hypothetical protein TcBrA4_0031400 [Trypanosoma cruzi]|nr:hypothetical protein TcBrA4_0031400 [Trypanosoma cruzi]
MAEKQHGDLGGVSERYKSCVDPKSRVSPMRRDSASQSSLDRFFPSIGSREQRNLFSFLSSGEKKPSLASLMEEEREALGDSVTLEERQAFKEAAVAAAGGIGSADPYSRLPHCEVPMMVRPFCTDQGRDTLEVGHPIPAAGDTTGGAGGDTATSSDIDPLDLTQAPGALGSTGSEKGGRGDAPSRQLRVGTPTGSSTRARRCGNDGGGTRPAQGAAGRLQKTMKLVASLGVIRRRELIESMCMASYVSEAAGKGVFDLHPWKTAVTSAVRPARSPAHGHHCSGLRSTWTMSPYGIDRRE